MTSPDAREKEEFAMSVFDSCETEIVDNAQNGGKIQPLPLNLLYTWEYKTIAEQIKHAKSTNSDKILKQKMPTTVLCDKLNREHKNGSYRTLTNNMAYEINNWLKESSKQLPIFVSCGQSNPKKNGHWIYLKFVNDQITDEQKPKLREFISVFNKSDVTATVEIFNKYGIIDNAKKNVIKEQKIKDETKLKDKEKTKFIDDVQDECKRIFVNHVKRKQLETELTNKRTDLINAFYKIGVVDEIQTEETDQPDQPD